MRWRRRGTPRTLYFAPDYTKVNPFQTMMNAALAPGIVAVPVPMRRITEGLRAAAAGSVFHLHWTAPILQTAPDQDAAERALADFTEALVEFQSRRGRVIWSIHNVLPHDVKHRDVELALMRLLAERADRVHVLWAGTPAAVASLYPIDPSRTVLIEHSSYAGVYPDEMSRADARQQLGIDADAAVILALGAIRPYKGLDRLLDVVDSLEAIDLRVLVAGRVPKGEFADDLRARCEANPRVIADFSHIPDDELQIWFRASDVAVLPYLDILNSGSFWLAASFGVPIVAPRLGALAEFDGEPFVRLFDPEDDESLRQTVSEALGEFVGDEDAPAAARAAAASRPPQDMAEAYADVVRDLLA